VKALSLQQPWVYAILHAGKNVENRSWRTHYRGWIALHASARPMPAAENVFPGQDSLPDVSTLPLSAICGVARLVAIVSESRSEWFYRPEDGSRNYGWVLEDVTPLPEPVPCKGALSLWEVPPDVVRAIRKQLPELDLNA
jgi:hypothetical protein